jgi:hypothetical protein
LVNISLWNLYFESPDGFGRNRLRRTGLRYAATGLQDNYCVKQHAGKNIFALFHYSFFSQDLKVLRVTGTFNG